MKIANDVTQLIGRTPVIRLNKLISEKSVQVFVKLESFNPGGSIKDRIALGMIEEAERRGHIDKNTIIVEPTSGNTGIGLAMVAAAKGYKLLLVMPETMSEERRKLMKAFGADFLLTPGNEGMDGAVKKAEELTKRYSNYYMPQQFTNPINPKVHVNTTALEIIEQTGGRLDIFVAGVGTGGTITGVGKVLKEKIPDIQIIAVEPETSAVLSGEKQGAHQIQGIGAGFIPDVLDTDIIDSIIRVSDKDAFETTRKMASEEGLLVGISSGAAVWAALDVAKQLEPEKRVLAIAADTGQRYLSTGLF